MKRIRVLYYLVIISLLSLTSCKNGDPGPTGPTLTGDVIGYCYIYDVLGTNVVNHSGVLVTAEGSNKSAITDSSGRFFITGLSTGTYNIAYSKSGYGTRKTISYQFVGNGQAYLGPVGISQLPVFSITNLRAVKSADTIKISGTLTGSLPIGNRWIRLFFGKSSGVSFNPSDYLYNIPVGAGNASTTFSTNMSAQSFYGFGSAAGQTVYIIAYSESYVIDSYIDILTGKFIFPNLNKTPSNIVSVVVP